MRYKWLGICFDKEFTANKYTAEDGVFQRCVSVVHCGIVCVCVGMCCG